MIDIDAGTVAVEREKGLQWPVGPWGPLVLALGIVALSLGGIVASSPSAWMLLGPGHNLVPEHLYPLFAFFLLLATMLGQAVGWAGGALVAHHLMTRVGFSANWDTVRLAMTAVYLGLAVGPLAVYEFFFGGPLLGLPRLGLPEWLQAAHPDAYWLLIVAHPLIDLSLAPLAAVFLVVLWGLGGRVRHRPGLQLVFWLALLATSMAVALSLGIHSTLAHIRL